VPEADVTSVGPTADRVTVQALSPAQLARYRDLYRSSGSGTATLEALRMGVAEAQFTGADGKRTTVRGKGVAIYAEALYQQASIAADLLAEVIHRLSRGEGVEAAYPFARAILGDDEEPEEKPEEGTPDGATFPGEPTA
jgi:hypothetical protein